MKLKLEINKKGRKWIHVTVIDEKFTKKAQLLLDENTKNFNVGDTIEGDFDLEKTFNRYFKTYDWTLVYITEDIVLKRKEEQKQREENKSIERLNRLANQWLNYIDNNMKERGKWYQRGEDTAKEYASQLKEKGCLEEYQRIINEVEELREKCINIEEKVREEESKYVIHLHNFEYKYIKDTVVEQNGILYKIVKTKGFYEPDALSFGGYKDNQYMYTAEADSRLVTEEDKKQYYKNKKEQEDYLRRIEEEQRPKQEKCSLIRKLKDYIRTDGYVNSKKISLFELEENAMIIENTFDIYGGGEKLIIQNDKAWFILNNGGDGDRWDINTIETHGAGAIGFYHEVDNIIAEILQSINQIK